MVKAQNAYLRNIVRQECPGVPTTAQGVRVMEARKQEALHSYLALAAKRLGLDGPEAAPSNAAGFPPDPAQRDQGTFPVPPRGGYGKRAKMRLDASSGMERGGVRREEEEEEEGQVWTGHEGVFALDIETTGVEDDCDLTCVCTWDGTLGRTWFFRDPVERAESRDELLQRMETAERILTFGGARFDLPVLARCLGVGPGVLGGWMRKLVDPLYAAPIVLGEGATQKLDEFLERNGMPGKTGSGAQAVEMAREGRWDDLGSYCLDDARLTYEVIMARGWWTDGVRYDPWSKRSVFRLCDVAVAAI